MVPPVERWHVRTTYSAVAPGERCVVLAEPGDSSAASPLVMPFHEVMLGRDVPRASEVTIDIPGYRGKRFLHVLSWLAVTRLAASGARACWRLERQQGPASTLTLLQRLGWTLEKSRRGRQFELRGVAPSSSAAPEPRTFTTRLGARDVSLAADYGVFSPERVDDGTALLLDVALGAVEARTVADIGSGYGPLAIGLALNLRPQRTLATEVDSVAMWLTKMNARRAQVPIEAWLEGDPRLVPPTELSVCNVGTHLSLPESRRLVGGLVERAEHGRVLAVVHSTLEERYARHFRVAGYSPISHRGSSHVVLEVDGRSTACRKRSVTQDAGPRR